MVGRAVLAAVVLVAGLPAACNDGDDATAPRSAVVLLSEDADEGLVLAARDLATYLARMTGREVEVIPVDPVTTLAAAVGYRGQGLFLVGPTAAALTVLGREMSDLAALGDEGFALRRIEAGGKVVVAAVGGGSPGAQYAVYDLARRLGVRFLHPEYDLVPEPGHVPVPVGLDLQESPAFARRGFHLETTHPMELLEAFVGGDGEEGLQRALRYVDWLVKNKQNWVQWTLLESVPLDEVLARGAAIVDYAHRRGVGVGAVVTFVGEHGNVLRLVNSEQPGDDAAEIQDALLLLRAAVPWDAVVAGFARRVHTPAGDVRAVGWMNTAAGVLHDAFGAEFYAISDLPPTLLADSFGSLYYHLPEIADPRVGVYVRSAMFYDLERIAPVYGAVDLAHQAAFLDRNAGGEHPLVYAPDASAWGSFDLDVPLLLPVYVEARARDLALLAAMAGEGDGIWGHVTSTSGGEWGYWLHDYAVAALCWDPSRPWEEVVAEAMAPAASAASETAAVLQELALFQGETLLAGGGIRYLVGEDAADDLARFLAVESHPLPTAPSVLMDRDGAELAAFESTVIAGLDTVAAHAGALESRVAAALVALAPSSGWSPADAEALVREVLDGTQLLRLRAEHAAALYRAVLTAHRAELSEDPAEAVALWAESGALLAGAAGIADEAQRVVAAREPFYRYPLALSVGDETTVPNATLYARRALSRVRDLYYWRRAEARAASAIARTVSGLEVVVWPVELPPAGPVVVDASAFAAVEGAEVIISFGDGLVITDPADAVASHVYPAGGQFLITTTVTGPLGGTVDLQERVAVVLFPMAVAGPELTSPDVPALAVLMAQLLPPLRIGITQLGGTSMAAILGFDRDEDGASDPGSLFPLPAGTVSATGSFDLLGGVLTLDASALGGTTLSVASVRIYGDLDSPTNPTLISPGTLSGDVDTDELIALLAAADGIDPAVAAVTVAGWFGFVSPASLPPTVPILIGFTATPGG